MALLTTGNFYTATFYPESNAAWAPYASTANGVQGALGTAIRKAAPDPVAIYVIDASAGLFAYLGGQAYGFDDALLNGVPTIGTPHTLTATDGTTTVFGLLGAATLYMYDSVTGVLRTFSGAEVTSFKAFLP